MLGENINFKIILFALASRPGSKQSTQQLGVGDVGVEGLGVWGGGVVVRSLTAILSEPKSLYLSPPESTIGLRMGRRWAVRFNQPAMRSAS